MILWLHPHEGQDGGWKISKMYNPNVDRIEDINCELDYLMSYHRAYFQGSLEGPHIETGETIKCYEGGRQILGSSGYERVYRHYPLSIRCDEKKGLRSNAISSSPSIMASSIRNTLMFCSAAMIYIFGYEYKSS